MIKVPNIVMVFSNSTPDVKELARDRWNIFSIENDELVKRQISKSWPPVVLTFNKNESNGLKKKKYPQDSDDDSDSDYQTKKISWQANEGEQNSFIVNKLLQRMKNK